MLVLLIAIIIGVFLLNCLSYRYIKAKIMQRQHWDLNICCGRTDGGGVNADIFKHCELPHFVLVENIYNLPFGSKQFSSVLCSHTMEHVEDPTAFHEELRRVGHKVTLVLPPLWDLGAALNFFEHKWIFLTFKKEHHTLPLRIRMPFARTFQQNFGQYIRA